MRVLLHGHNADGAPAVEARSCQSVWAWSKGSGWRADAGSDDRQVRQAGDITTAA